MEESSLMFGDILTKIKQSRFVQKGLEIFFQRKMQQWLQRDILLQQESFFFEYIEGLQESLYWKEYGFDLDSVEDFQDLYKKWKISIPIWNHDTMGAYMETEWWTWKERSLKKRRHALSWWTTQQGKNNKKQIYIPYNNDALNQSAFQTITANVMYYFWYETIFKTNFLPLGGSIRYETDDVISADVSALLIASQNSILASTIYPYSIEVLTSSWEKKYLLFLETIHERNVWSIMGTTKRVAMMLDEIYNKYPDHRVELQKSLQCILRGGVDIGPYRSIFEKLGITNLMWVYNAAEGLIGFQDLSITDEVRYQFLETGFFECIPRSCIKGWDIYDVDLPCFWTWELTKEIFEEYWQDFLLIYSTSGQIRSPMDVLRLQFFWDQLRFQIVGRVGGFINLVGEELLEAHARSAIDILSRTLWVIIESWTVAPSLDSKRHDWVIEYLWDYTWNEIALILDTALQTINGDYADKRRCDWLGIPHIYIVPEGVFDSYHTSQGRIWGQTKSLMMSNKRIYIDGILAL
jgi:GH3 auxin-responsive promoter